jgi:hypothetical protein
MECKLKHLEFIQGVINRMAANSFLLKGWSLTLVAAVFALAAKDGNSALVPVAYLPAIVFWFLDAYFLRQERLYRALYDDVRSKGEQAIDFDLNAQRFSSSVNGYGKVLVSITLRWFHGVLLLTVIAVHILTKVG